MEVPGAVIPGIIDGKVLTESIGSAGRFNRVPLVNGIVTTRTGSSSASAPVVNGHTARDGRE